MKFWQAITWSETDQLIDIARFAEELGFYGLAVYLRAITDEQDLSTTAVSAATSLFFIVGAITGRVIAPVPRSRTNRRRVPAS